MQETIVLRESKKLTVEVEKLVVGDIVEVKSGDRLPADIRIIKSAGFKVLAVLPSNKINEMLHKHLLIVNPMYIVHGKSFLCDYAFI